MCVKGSTDYICRDGTIVGHVDEPSVDVLEAIGGTGDTLTGIVSALIHQGMDIERACMLAARTNRRAGELAEPTPATQIDAIIDRIPEAIDRMDIPMPSILG
jgi:NAD(P)H-hydrate repair Nnr-like enzyme with NAD(P)H-hydrate dehydratase domain